MKITDFDSFLQNLGIPKICELNKPIYKKMFLDNGILDATDKKCLKDDVDKIRWLYTLKPSTINIAPYFDKEHEYPELAVLHLELSSPNRFKRIAHFINRSIPYPLILLFTCNIEDQASLAIYLADKRINQGDKEKWVIEDSIHTDWITLSEQSGAENQFLNSLAINNLSFTNFFNFYKALTDRVTAIQCASYSGEFLLDYNSSEDGNQDRLTMLREIEKLYTQKSGVANKLKKEKQMGRQVEMNIQIKQISDKIAQFKGNL
jgi:hypothetical protein